MGRAEKRIQIYVRFHRDICSRLALLAERSGRRRATTAAWILTRAVAVAVMEHPDYAITAEDLGLDGSEEVYFLAKGRQEGAKAGPAMILTMDRQVNRDLELLAGQLNLTPNQFRTAILAHYLGL